MTVDPSAAGTQIEARELTWTSKDSLLYALGVGAGHAPAEELAFTTENTARTEQQAVPSMAVVLSAGMGRLMKALGPFDQTTMLHGAEEFELGMPLPAEGRVDFTACIKAIHDKGSAAVIVFEKTGRVPATGELCYRARTSLYLRGEGGWGGDRGPSSGSNPLPSRPPDRVVEYETRPEQALLYRLSGDRNPLHSDPAFAARGGLPRPILHGLCTYGFTCRALVRGLCDGGAARLTGMSARFSSPVFPGDKLSVEMWRTDDHAGVFRTLVPERGAVLDGGTCTFRS